MNAYLPRRAVIEDVLQETQTLGPDVKTYRLRLDDGPRFAFLPGQFVELSLPGVGEAPFGFSSRCEDEARFDVTIKRTGSLTEVIHALDKGDCIWVRGPFGNHFPLQDFAGHPLVFIAGGLGLAPLRPVIQSVLHPAHRADYGPVALLLAARTAGEHLFAHEYDRWRQAENVTLTLAIDTPQPGWPGKTGLPHQLLADWLPPGEDTRVLLCGPPVMIKAVAGALAAQGLPKRQIYTTLEMRMSCGVGKCGRCNIGRRYVCVDGPVFRLDALDALPQEY